MKAGIVDNEDLDLLWKATLTGVGVTLWFDGISTEYGGFHKWRYPNSWMVYFMENPSISL
jgi:hypothetical protein